MFVEWDHGLEFLRNFGLFMLGVIFLMIMTTIIRRSKILTAIFRFIGKVLLVLVGVFFLLFYIGIYSFLAGIVIFFHQFFTIQPAFFADEEAVFLGMEDLSLVKFAITYGALYVFMNFIVRFYLSKTRIAKFFTMVSKKIANFILFYSNLSYEEKVTVVTKHLMTLTAVFLVYPVIVSLLFPELSVTLLGNFALFVSLFLFSFMPDRKERLRNTYYY